MRRKDRNTSTLLLAVAVVGVVLLTSGTAVAGNSGRCYTAEITAAIVLPDGSTHAPGSKLRFCLTHAHSPVESLHHTSVDGRAIGLFRSRRGSSEGLGGQTAAFFVFYKRDDGALELQGFAHPTRDGQLITYNVDLKGARVTTNWRLAEEFARDEGMILIAAR